MSPTHLARNPRRSRANVERAFEGYPAGAGFVRFLTLSRGCEKRKCTHQDSLREHGSLLPQLHEVAFEDPVIGPSTGSLGSGVHG
jgi:hypothetical protein